MQSVAGYGEGEWVSMQGMLRTLAGTSVMLALTVAALLVVGLAGPAPGLAAPEPVQLGAVSGGITSGLTGEMTHTVYLAFIGRSKPIVPNVWEGEYYANPGLDGDAQYTTEEVRVDYDWGNGGAPPGLPADRFSIRWTGYWDFEVGEYTFFVYGDDGVRLWLDETMLIDAWQVGLGSYQASVVVATAGLHRLKLEYFENTGGAAVRLHWRRTDLYPQWQGEYYSQPWVEYGKEYERTDSVIQFDWGHGCPPGLPCDHFSVGWNARRLFAPGTHRIFLYADEGYQLYVDGNKIGEGGWYNDQPGGSIDAVYTLEIPSLGYHDITYNFHDRGTLAEARLWIEDLERPKWKAEYFANMNLGDPPSATRYVDRAFDDWGFGKPRHELPTGDHFSVRWSGQRYFHAGCYRFGLFADDGVRLWVDDELLVDEWHDGRAEYHSPVTYLSTGYHAVLIEYYENIGEAEMRFWWE